MHEARSDETRVGVLRGGYRREGNATRTREIREGHLRRTFAMTLRDCDEMLAEVAVDYLASGGFATTGVYDLQRRIVTRAQGLVQAPG